jgi:probable S-adenosylmethionine-dependent methyltransferase, YraL family
MSQKSYDNSPTLYLIPTPIGNMEDITLRAVKTLELVEAVFCEDTRVTGLLLNHLGIKKKMIANHEHNEENNRKKIIEYLSNGFNVGLVSDRGTPIISDPGYELSRYIIESGYNVVSLPGATALIPALTSSGIAPMPFLFYGFLNSKNSKREKELENLKNEVSTLIFYESPHRIEDTLKSLGKILGLNRKISISREITKKFEEVYRGTIEEIIKENNEYKGELVVVVSGNSKTAGFESLTLLDHINLYINDGMNKMDAIKIVSKERGLKKSEVYNEYLKYEERK